MRHQIRHQIGHRLTAAIVVGLSGGLVVAAGCFGGFFAIRALGYPVNYQAAGPAIALMLSVTLTSVIKAKLLGHLLGASVNPWRMPLVIAALAAIVVGGAFTALPKRFEWVELVVGEPAIAATYLFILWKWAFGPADRALFGKTPGIEPATLPHSGSPVR